MGQDVEITARTQVHSLACFLASLNSLNATKAKATNCYLFSSHLHIRPCSLLFLPLFSFSSSPSLLSINLRNVLD